MNVPNHERKTFRDMTPEDRAVIVEAWIAANPLLGCDVQVLTDRGWATVILTTHIPLDIIYRTRPRQLVIPWEVIKPEYKWAAMDGDGSIFVYDVEPNLSLHDWVRNGGLPECIDALNINTTGIDWRESLVQRPEKV